MTRKEVHVLVVTLPFQGHINPMLRLAKRLVSKGLYVTFATTETARQRLLGGSSAATSITRFQFEFFKDGLGPEVDRDKNLDILLLEALPTKGVENFSNLIADLSKRGRKFSCVINQPFVPWSAAVAAEHGIPTATLFIQPFSLFSIYYRYHKGLNLFPSLENPNNTLKLPGLPLMKVSDLPTFVRPESPYHFRKLLAESVKSLEKVKWVLGNSFQDLEKGVLEAMEEDSINNWLPVGPFLASALLGEKEEGNVAVGGADMWKAEDSCLEWLDGKPVSSVVYVAFGSITVLDGKQMESMAAALKNSGKPFLWVVRSPAKDSDEKKSNGLPEGFIEEMKGRGLVVPWCHQEKVLMHPAVACFVSHCGWNSSLEAVVAGVPVIAFPEWTDQPTNAKLLVDAFKIGVRLGENDRDFSSEEVERCIRAVTDGPGAAEIKRRAAELKEAARKAVADGGSSERNLNRFISEISA